MPAYKSGRLPAEVVSEARERGRAALIAWGSRPRPAASPSTSRRRSAQEGSHYDLPIAPRPDDPHQRMPHGRAGRLHRAGRARSRRLHRRVAGVLPAAIGANARGEGLFAPPPAGRRPPGRPDIEIVAASSSSSSPTNLRARRCWRGRSRKSARSKDWSICRHQGPGERQARARSRAPAATICCWSAPPARASRCWPRGCLRSYRRSPLRNCSKSR